MKIGIDITLLQSAHRQRGIGYTLIHTINNMPEDVKKAHSFVFYAYDKPTDLEHYAGQEDLSDPLKPLNLKDIKYEVRIIQPQKKHAYNLQGPLHYINNVANYLERQLTQFSGDQRITDFSDIDWFMQFNQNQQLPPPSKVKSVVIVYDLIQYVMESDYLYTYKTARALGRSRKAALRHGLIRRQYLAQMRALTSRARKVIAISEYTKKDFVRLTHVKESRISVCHLGVEPPVAATDFADSVSLNQYQKTSWGYVPRKFSLDSKDKFILFVGGADPRRKLVQLFAAYNNLRAQGHDVKLILAGDTMQGPERLPEDIRDYLTANPSYKDGVHFVGFVTEKQKEWLYSHAVAFVYPSVYEGFGLPVLEAMRYGTPVITFDNTSLKEVAGDAALYATDQTDIAQKTVALLEDPNLRKKYAKLGKERAAKFSWKTTARTIFDSFLKH